LIPQDYPYEIQIGSNVSLAHAYQLQANYIYYQVHRNPKATPLKPYDDMDTLRRKMAPLLPSVMTVYDITIEEPTRVSVMTTDGRKVQIPVIFIMPLGNVSDKDGYRTDLFGFKTNDENWEPGKWLI